MHSTNTHPSYHSQYTHLYNHRRQLLGSEHHKISNHRRGTKNNAYVSCARKCKSTKLQIIHPRQTKPTKVQHNATQVEHPFPFAKSQNCQKYVAKHTTRIRNNGPRPAYLLHQQHWQVLAITQSPHNSNSHSKIITNNNGSQSGYPLHQQHWMMTIT